MASVSLQVRLQLCFLPMNNWSGVFLETLSFTLCILCLGWARPSPTVNTGILSSDLWCCFLVFFLLKLKKKKKKKKTTKRPKSLLLSPKSNPCYLGDCVVTSYLSFFRCWWSTELGQEVSARPYLLYATAVLCGEARKTLSLRVRVTTASTVRF